jgi:hypothetical protein
MVRLVLIGVGLATALLFLMTLPRLGELSTFPTFWMLFYLVDPLLVLFTFWKLGWRASPTRSRNPLAPLWIVQSIIFGVGGIVLLVLPQTATAFWPWSMTVQLSQLYSMFFISISFMSLLAAREPGWADVQFLVFMIGALALLVLVASVLHLDRFRPGLLTIVWFVFFALEALAFGGLYVRTSLRAPAKGVVA